MEVRTFINKFFPNGRERGKNIFVECIHCHGGEHNKKSMAIDIETGTYTCNRKNNCSASGSFFDLRKYMGVNDNKPKQPKVVKEKQRYLPIKKAIKDQSDKEIKFFADRKINKETVDFFRVTVGKYFEKPALCFPYFYKGEVANIKYRLQGKDFRQEKDNYSTLWNIDNVKGEELIITEGEIDCMTLWQCGLHNVTSIPSGAESQNWIDNNWEELEKFNTIYLSFDDDAAGLKALKRVSTRLGMHRCKEVRFKQKDANDALMAGLTEEEICNIVRNAKDIAPDKISLPDTFEQDMIYELNDPDYLKGSPSVFNKLTDNGFSGYRKGEVTIWTGFSGEGKSTVVLYEMLNQIIVHNRICCIASLESKPSRWLKTMLLQMLGVNYHSYNETVIQGALSYLKHKLAIVNYVGKISASDLFECFEYSAKRYGATNFVIDNLMKVDLNLKEGYEGHKNFINDLSGFANKFGVHIHLVAHQKKPNESKTKYPEPSGYGILGSSELFNGADNVITVYRIPDAQKEESNDGYDSYLNVWKQREYPERPKVGLVFQPGSRSFKGGIHDELPNYLRMLKDVL